MELQPVKASQIPTEQAIFNKGWKMLKDFYNIEQNSNDDLWKSLIDEADRLYKMGKDPATKKLSKSIALGVLEYIELVSKNRQ